MRTLPTEGQIKLFRELNAKPGDSMTHYATALGITREGVSKQLESAEASGWVRERRLTAKGREWLRMVAR